MPNVADSDILFKGVPDDAVASGVADGRVVCKFRGVATGEALEGATDVPEAITDVDTRTVNVVDVVGQCVLDVDSRNPLLAIVATTATAVATA